ncbi:hypothetical protein [Pseudoclavibacter sp. RFBB5]|uniref:hypothetical protein n=1 Tax=Pseudoclavibacter sp. RFBB5 TaxID=2080574 RepID=UPI0011B0076F|nr:hypothetical protein [Pseudoclavibacter sp. RFBB5]
MNEQITAWVWQQDCQPEDKLTMLAIARCDETGRMPATDLRGVQRLTGATEEEAKASIGRLDFLGLVEFKGSLVVLAGAGDLS